jgi:hypothetical protein
MPTNETIARWRFGDIKPDEHWRDPDEAFWLDGELYYSEMAPDPETGQTSLMFCPFSPDTDISLWHGDDGLLKTIEQRGLRERFSLALLRADETELSDTDYGLIWLGLRAEAPQLAAALLKCIEGEKKANP